MSELPAQPRVQSTELPVNHAADSQLLMDQFLPRYDFSIVHADVFRAGPAACYAAACGMDLFQAPVVRILLGIRALPQGLADAIKRRGETPAPEAAPRAFRLKDMVGLGWIMLGENPGVQMVLGQVGRPWKSIAGATDAPTTPEQFASFDEPGFAKIASSLKIDRYGNASSIVTVETRVSLTDDRSRRRFRRYWLLIGPFSSLIRRTALHMLAGELRRRGGQWKEQAE